MSEKRSLGRGLGDMIEEVSTVNAVPVQTAAAADAATNETKKPEETPAPVATEPVLVEERPADVVINSKQPVRVEREIVKEPVVPGWAWGAIAVLVIAAAVLGGLYYQADKKAKETQKTLAETADSLKTAQAALVADPMPWVNDIRIPGVRVERTKRVSKLAFEAPFFAGDVRWSPASAAKLREVLVQLSSHAADCYVTVVGHTARTPLPAGSPYKSDYEIGLRRAEAVVGAMVREGWPVETISMRSAGSQNPPFAGSDMLSQIRNRTVTIELRPK